MCLGRHGWRRRAVLTTRPKTTADSEGLRQDYSSDKYLPLARPSVTDNYALALEAWSRRETKCSGSSWMRAGLGW